MHEIGTKWSDFETDPDLDRDSGSFFDLSSTER